jgi:hypothetical protein
MAHQEPTLYLGGNLASGGLRICNQCVVGICCPQIVRRTGAQVVDRQIEDWDEEINDKKGMTMLSFLFYFPIFVPTQIKSL